MKMQFKTPIRYYGGKQKLIPYILPRIPAHTTYVEPFAGGGAVFWAKEAAEVEILNDTDKELINFYTVMQNNFVKLKKEVKKTLHCRDQHRRACVINTYPDMFGPIERAWAIWVLSSQSFSGLLDGGWGYDKTQSATTNSIRGKRTRFTKELASRLENVQLESTDALYVINSRDNKYAFHYIDPPYVGSDCGHYNSYTIQDFENLLEVLSKIKGKFLLSSYPSEILMKYAKRNRWNMFSIEQKVSVNAKNGNLKRKTEVLTANYPIN